jgi:predicted nucleic acid-binding protein
MTKAAPRRSAPERRYWDSTVFLAWLLAEKDRTVDCRSVIDAAQRGKVLIVTSVLTLTEVIKLKGHPPLARDQQRVIDEFFQRSYIVPRGLDRFTAYEARELIWKHGLHPKDSVHVATAIHNRIRIFETHDGELLKLTGTLAVPGGAPMTIRLPHYAETLALFPGTKQARKKKADG